MNYWEMRPGRERDLTRDAYYHDLDQKWLSVTLQRHALPYPPGLTATRDGDRVTLRCGNRVETIQRKHVCATTLKVYINSFTSPAPATMEPTNQGAENENC